MKAHKPLHNAPTGMPLIVRDYGKGEEKVTVTIWQRFAGTCLTTPASSYHAVGCWQGDTSRDHGGLIGRVADHAGKLIVETPMELRDVNEAAAQMHRFARSVMLGEHLAIASQKAKKGVKP